MANVKGSYLKNESGEKISPITSTDTIYNGTTKLIDFFYPVGSYYETSNEDFNPNTSWGGTWVRDTIGLVTVGAYKEGDYAYAGGSTDFEKIVQATVGEEVGEKTCTLTVNQLPSHRHKVVTWSNYAWSTRPTGKKIANTIDNADGQCENTSTSSTGEGQPHNNVQPSIGVYRWHRTA